MAALSKTSEPVLAGSAALALLNAVGTVLITHGVVTNTQASSLTQAVAPTVAAALTLAAGWLVRRFTTPWHKVATALEQTGLVSDADIARIGQLLRDELDSVFVHTEPPASTGAAVAATEADLVPHVRAPDGMSAGVPNTLHEGA